MARFAWDCLKKSNVVFNALAGRLGEGTKNLDLRIGMHSGAVTAGVLRGEKGRFQIFGDTVNTAARMESSSRPGSIHCSKSTADLICYAGKSDWVTERQDKIVAKGKTQTQSRPSYCGLINSTLVGVMAQGKGEMTTFWVNPKGSGSHSTVLSRESSEAALCTHFDVIQGPSKDDTIKCDAYVDV